MERKIAITPDGEEEFKSVYDYLRSQSEKWAEDWERSFYQKLESLEKYPYMYRMVPEIGMKSMREFFVGSFRVFYIVTENIIGVRHFKGLIPRI